MAARGVYGLEKGARQDLGHILARIREEQAVGVDGDDGRRSDVAQSAGDAAAVATDVVGEHRPREYPIAARVETSDELVPVVVEVGLDGKAASTERVFCGLGDPPEAGVELLGAAVGGVGDLAGQGQPGVGA